MKISHNKQTILGLLLAVAFVTGVSLYLKQLEKPRTLAETIMVNMLDHPNDWSDRDGNPKDTTSKDTINYVVAFDMPTFTHTTIIENKKCNIKIVHIENYIGNADSFEMISPDSMMFFDHDKEQIITAYKKIQTIKSDSIAEIAQRKRLLKEEEIKAKLCK